MEQTDQAHLPVLPLRDVVVYPHMVIPLFVGREKSIRALEMAAQNGKGILLVAQKSADVDDPGEDDLYTMGTVSNILQLLKLPDQTVKVLVEGHRRARIDGYVETDEWQIISQSPESHRHLELGVRLLSSFVLLRMRFCLFQIILFVDYSPLPRLSLWETSRA